MMIDNKEIEDASIGHKSAAVSEEGLKPYILTAERAEKWARKPSWTQTEARRLARNIDPTLYKQKKQNSSSVFENTKDIEPPVSNKKGSTGKKPNLPELMRRALRANQLDKHPTPISFIKWLDLVEYTPPEQLRVAVLEANEKSKYWRRECERLQALFTTEKQNKSKLKSLLRKKERQIKQFEDKANDEQFRPQEKKQLYRFLMCWVKTLGYQHNGQPSEITGKIASFMILHGLEGADADTIRKYINNSYSLLNDSKKPKSKSKPTDH